ncbi:YukJ family protein [Paenibacillus sp. Aloe-11]|uniref:YukJ family protein n=1 Tax=Paenibacillus sp. Aloe-11 TaxID=1050222 RepID=UPI00024EF896|nr:YukJ family protein [Paenibacillus sp. Aloe-11]EHS56503.1 hypothetical protein WG8_2773 [Paenibacillus sp. Aloe-11]
MSDSRRNSRRGSGSGANSRYGVLIGRVIDIHKDPESDQSPHYNIVVEADHGKQYKLPINVQSIDPDLPRSLYYSDENYNAQAITILPTMNSGFHDINYHQNVNADIAVDFIRSGLFDPNKMEILPFTAPGENNDLYDFIDKYMHKALNNEDATIYAYGTHFTGNGLGVHNIHMNQGNSKYSSRENDIFHDGCFLVHFTAENKWIAYFLAFQSQSWCTDDHGKPLQGSIDQDGHPLGACKYSTVQVELQRDEPVPVG